MASRKAVDVLTVIAPESLAWKLARVPVMSTLGAMAVTVPISLASL